MSETEFGYKSVHFEIELPACLQALPEFDGCFGLRAEIQVRSLSQHLWASASHQLQYKNEQSVPKPIKRSLIRLAAILETVDFELERILNARSEYRSSSDIEPETAPLNVDNLESILRSKLPKGIWIEDHDFSELVEDLSYFGIHTRIGLTELIDYYAGHLPVVDPDADLRVPSDDPWDDGYIGDYSPAGVVHTLLHLEFKERYDQLRYEKAVEAFKDFAPEPEHV